MLEERGDHLLRRHALGRVADDHYVVYPGGTTGFVSLRQLLGYEDFSSLQFQTGIRMEF